jgi:trehalose/maltose hydrolase-like predicted phosphorylase
MEQGGTGGGVHLGAPAGSIDILQRHYLGLRAHNGVPWIDPAMPEAPGPVRLDLQFRCNELEVEAAGNRLQIKSRVRQSLRCGNSLSGAQDTALRRDDFTDFDG